MKLPEIAVRRRTTFLMIFILMVGLGIYGFSLLGLDFVPEMSLNSILILTALPGAGPEETETLVSEVVENSVALVNGVEHIGSSSSSNLSIVTVEFGWGTDIDQAEIDVRNALSMADQDLPEDAHESLVFVMDPSMSPVMVVSIGSGSMNGIDLRTLVDDEIAPMLNRMEGVASVVVYGGLKRQINVLAEPALMERHKVSISQVAAALAPVRNNVPAGTMDSGGQHFVLNIETAFHNISEIEGLVVGYHDGVPIHLGDVCTVEDGTEEVKETISVDGESAVMAMVYRRAGSNSVEVCDNVREGLQQIEERYGSMLSAGVVYDQSTFIEGSVTNLSKTGAMAVIIAVLVLLFFLGSLKTSGIVGLSIPLSILLTFPVMALFGVNLNMISLAGLALAVGMLVDNSIVVLENIFRHRMVLGSSPSKAAVEGTAEVGMAISASTMTTLAVFIPIILVPGLAGQLFRDLSLTISSTLLVSLFVALTLIPLATSRMKSVSVTDGKNWLALAIERFLDRVDEAYVRGVRKAVKRKRTVIFSALGLFAMSVLAAVALPSEFIPDMDDGMVQFIVYRSPGTTLASTDSTMAAIVAELRTVIPPEAVEHIYYTAGESEGIASITGGSGTHKANLVIKLVPDYQREFSKTYISGIVRGVLSCYPDVEYSKNDPLAAAMQGGDPVVVNIFGSDMEVLSRLGEELAGAISEIDGVEEARSSLSERIVQLSFVPNYSVLSLRAASPAIMGAETNLAVMGSDLTVLRENAREYDVNLRYPLEYRGSLEAISAAVINGMPLASWGNLEENLIPATIIRRDQSRMVSVTGSLSGTRTIGQVAPDVERLVESFDLRGCRFEIGGQIEDQKETFQGLMVALFASALLVYMVMASQFESLLEPFIIILTVPLAFSGAVIMLAATGTTLSALSFIGIIMLTGIVVNNGIVLIDYANQLLDQGKSRTEAIMEAGRTRLRPILMTAATTAIAMVPVAIGGGEGGQIYAPMGRTVIGGLAVGTFLTLFVVPCLYLLLGQFRKRMERRL